MLKRNGRSRLASWGLFLAVLFTVGTGFNPGSLKRCGCSVDPEEAARFKDLAGRILAAPDNSPLPGAPVSGAQIDLGDRMTTSNGQGEFLFRDVAPGSYPLMITAAGYRPYQQMLTWPSAGDDPLTILLSMAGSQEMPLPVRDAKVVISEPIRNFGTDESLCFEWANPSLAGQGLIYAYIDFNQSLLPPGATINSVRLHGTRLPSSNPDGGGGDEEESPRRFAPLAAQDDIDVIFDAYAVLEGWNEDEINYVNRPRDFSGNLVATAALPPMTGDTFSFSMDLTQFARDRQAGRTQAAGFILVARERLTSTGAALHYITSSEYLPAEQALRVVAEYVDATGKTVEVTLR